MEIIKSLNLNVTPKDAPNGSLVYARNVMTDDTSSFLTNDIGFTKVLDFEDEEKIVGIIPCSEEIVIFTHTPVEGIIGGVSKIYRYTDKGVKTEVFSDWKWSGGKINGTYTYNYKGELIIAVAEYDANVDVPLKSINLDTCNNNGRLTYATEEIIPKYNCVPTVINGGHLICGTYTFFIRFKVDKYNYTKWFQITSEIHITNITKTDSYIHQFLQSSGNDNTDDEIIKVSPGNELNINSDHISNFGILLRFVFNDVNVEEFQIGYIVKRKSDTQGRIKGDYKITDNALNCSITDNSYIEEISIDSLLENPNQKFNVENIINYNNRLYIANYDDYENKKYNLESTIPISIAQNVNSFDYTESSANQHLGINRYNIELDSYWASYYETGVPDPNNPKTGRSITITLNAIDVNVGENGYLTNDSKQKFLNTLLDNMLINIGIISSEFITFNDETEINTNRYLFIQHNIESEYGNAICIAKKENNQNFNISNYWNWNFNVKNIDIYIDNDVIKFIYNGDEYEIYNRNDNTVKTNVSVLSGWYESPSRYTLYFGNLEAGTRGLDYPKPCRMYPNLFLKLRNVTLVGTQGSENDGEDGSVVVDGTTISSNFQYRKSLVPYQKYNYFIHFIRKDGSCTLGYYIGSTKYGLILTSNNKPIVPSFLIGSGIIPDEYIGCFISYERVEINSQHVYILDEDDGTSFITNPELIYDIDSIFGDKIVGEETSDSGSSKKIITFDYIRDGLKCNRVKIITDNALIDPDKTAFIIKNIQAQYATNVKVLYRLTKNFYIENVNTELVDDDYLPGYLTTQYVFDFNTPVIIDPAVSYVFNGESGIKTSYTLAIHSVEFYSHYFLEGMNVKSKFIRASTLLEQAKREVDTDKISLVINNVMPPYSLHDFLELQPAYSSKPSKAFTNYRETIIDRFDKTVYRSDVISDESLVNGFRRFDSSQYKNIFENKGKITNIVGIGLYFIVHTEYSIFVFDRSPKLSQYAQTEIPDTFSVDYQELMPTNEGYGGLLDREESIITKHGYFWYDKTNKIIFSFDQGKPSIVSSAINNYIKQLPIETCRFAEDIIHNRLIVCFKLTGEKYITLSYNISTKQFISFHDYRFTHNYKTYGKSYLFDESIENRNKLFVFDDRVPVNYDDLGITIGIDSEERYNVGDDTNNAGVNPSIIDIIFNEGFEVPKVLNSINYVLSKFNHNDAVYLPQILREYDDRLFPGDYIKIYTDEVITDVINVKDTKQNVNDYETYTKPKWEKGKWNLNYFRDIHHVNEEIGYTSDQESLVFGKYFVVRFIFENDVNNPTRFKLDNVNVNFELY